MRVLDFVLSLLGLILIAPFMIPVALVLRFTGEGEVFYYQSRVGRNSRSFSVIKFATMLKNSPHMGAGTITEKNDPRILPVGRFLRKTKINELPQLINVLIGDMSLIGPRPHAIRDLKGVDPIKLSLVTKMRPGLSGIGSIIFRNEETILHSVQDGRYFYDEVIAPYKAELELWYMKKYSISTYVELIVFTLFSVIGIQKINVFNYYSDLPPVPEDLKPFLVNR